jgi:hypothetical protein
MPQSTAGRVLLSMIAASCVTLTDALDTSPAVSLAIGLGGSSTEVASRWRRRHA